MQKTLLWVSACVACLLIGLGAGQIRCAQVDRSYRERLAIYIAEVERARKLYSSLETANRDLRTELERQRGTLGRAREIVDEFEQATSGSVGGIRRALEGLQTLRALIEALESD